MITKIHIVNCGSINDVEVNFLKSRYQFGEEYILNDSVANPIAIYGHNGSGKSSFLLAVEQMVSLLTSDKNDLQPFIFNFINKDNPPSGISIWFKIKEKEYCYSIRTKLNGITSEQLFVNNATVFDRNGNTFQFKSKTTKVDAVFYPTLRLLYNSATDNEDINTAYSFLANIVWAHAAEKNYLCNSLNNKKLMDVVEEKSNEVKDILKHYKSFPIYDIFSAPANNEKQYFLRIETKNPEKIVVPYGFSSTGMTNQSIILSLLLTIPDNGVMVIDEIESALHPETVMNFIKLVVKKNIQLIFTSHNTNILSHLRPDNVMFAHWSDGYSVYKRLSNIYPNIREVNNIEKMYLSSMFDEEIAAQK